MNLNVSADFSADEQLLQHNNADAQQVNESTVVSIMQQHEECDRDCDEHGCDSQELAPANAAARTSAADLDTDDIRR